MNIKKTLFLLALLGVAIGYLKYIALPAAKKRTEGGRVFESLPTGSLESLSIKRNPTSTGKEPELFELRRGAGAGVMPSSTGEASLPPKGESEDVSALQDGDDASAVSAGLQDWGIVEIQGAPLDSATLSGMISALRELNLGEEIEDSEKEADFSAFGLAKPELTVSVMQVGQQLMEVAFGGKNDYLGKRYVKASGRPGVYLVDESVFASLNKGRDELRDQTPIRFLDPDVREVLVKGSNGSFSLIQKSVGEWEVVGDKNYKASTVAVADLLRAAKDLKVADFLDAETPSGKNGLSSPDTKLTLHFREGVTPSTLDVAVGSVPSSEEPKEKNFFFTYSGAPSVLTTLADPFSRLTLSVDGMREKTIFSIASADVGKVVVSGSEIATVELISVDGIDWKVNGKAADPVFVEDVIGNIVSMKVDTFAPNVPKKQISTPTRRFEVIKKGTVSDKVVLLVGEKIGDAWVGQVEGKDELFLLKEEDLRRASPREETLLAPTPTAAVPPGATVSQ